ncbi:MAG: hypothetical protein R2815_08870 [Flavobacteriales bacterium]
MNKLKQLLIKRRHYVMRKTMHQRQIEDMNQLIDKDLRKPTSRGSTRHRSKHWTR